ncbi:MAG TPA: hypothetical protein VFV43_00700 [Limnobacter sp.]|nr:hypothetical protein [Limnobacter sp.]
MSASATYCKESKRIIELNWNYVQVVRHLQWQGRGNELGDVLNLAAEEALTLSGMDQQSLNELLETRATALFSIDLSASELTQAVEERIARQRTPLAGMVTHHAALLALADSPARSFIKAVLTEVQQWSAFSTNTAYRFVISQALVNQIGELDTAGIIKLAQSSSTVLKPRFNLAQLSALGRTGLVPAGLLFD